MNIYVVGIGGVGAWLSCALSKMLDADDELYLMDGDEVEEKNLDRQFFAELDIKSNKALSLAPTCDAYAIGEYLTEHYTFPKACPDLIFVCVDNHPARLAALKIADQRKCEVIIAANEYYEAEAYLYLPEWQGRELDPRVYFPEINTDTSGDPLAPGCTGEVAEHPQLASANFMAAAFALNLYTWMYLQSPEVNYDGEILGDFSPIRYSHAMGKTRTWTRKDQEAYGRQVQNA